MSSENLKVAILTGGASGFGLAVGTLLVKRGGWSVYLFDRNSGAGQAAASSLGSAATFHQVDVTDWSSLSQAFHKVFTTEKRIDFVFANAGIAEAGLRLYERHPADQVPPEPQLAIVDINLKAVITTSYLAIHYFRHSPPSDKNLVMTASAAGLYPAARGPSYSATKHGVVGFMRSIAQGVGKEGIRCNAICPSFFKTNLADEATWSKFFTPDTFGDIPFVADVVAQIIDGNDLVDTLGNRVEKGKFNGQTVEIIVDKVYLREAPTISNRIMAKTLGIADLESVMYLQKTDTKL